MLLFNLKMKTSAVSGESSAVNENFVGKMSLNSEFG